MSIVGEIGGIMFLVLLLAYLLCSGWQWWQSRKHSRDKGPQINR